MVCRKCGTPVREGSNFCSRCGAPVKNNAQNRQIRPGRYDNTFVKNEVSYDSFKEPGRSKNKRSLHIIIAVIAIVFTVSLATVMVVLLLKDPDNGTENTADNGSNASSEAVKPIQLAAYTPVDYASVPENAESDFVFTNERGVVTITGYNGNTAQIKIPSSLGGETERIKIERDAFRGNEKITYVYLPDQVTNLDSAAFCGCTALQEVRISGGIYQLDSNTFADCTSLRRVEMAEGFQVIGGGFDSGAFQNCPSLTEVIFPSTLTSIGNNAFSGCEALQEVDLSGTSAIMLGQLAFSECTSLRIVSLPVTMKGRDDNFSSNAFLNCPSLSELRIPEGNAELELEGSLLYGKNWEDKWILICNLQGAGSRDIVVREGTTEISSHAFAYDHALTSVTIPGSVENIGRYAFMVCDSLKQVKFAEGLALLGQGAFSHCSALEEVILPESLTEIVDQAFEYCTSLRKVSLPDNVTYLYDATTQKYIFTRAEKAVFTYRGKEYTYDQADELDAAIASYAS